MSETKQILFSTFEPSGDLLAAKTIDAMKSSGADLRIWALGGSAMKAAGADVIEHTTEHASMSADTAKQIFEHRKRLKRLRTWLQTNHIDLFIPTDSPAGNWSICKLVRKYHPHAKIVHLVAPQVWAWATWRIRKLRRLTDHVLCILPFEPDYFNERNVRATYVGHPIFEADTGERSHKGLPELQPRLAILPGSRTGEVVNNLPTMLRAFDELRKKHPRIRCVIAALDERIATMAKKIVSESPARASGELHVVHSRPDDIIDWCDLVLLASGTATLQVAANYKPMVVTYHLNLAIGLLFGVWAIRVKSYSLPNLVAKWASLDPVVPEIIPHFRRSNRILHELELLIDDEDVAQNQRNMLHQIIARFDDRTFSECASEQLLRHLD